MPAKRGRKPAGKPRAIRVTASLPPDNCAALEAIAKQKKVSVAWVIRDAVEKYVADQWPSLGREQP
ncbi:CopG family transcriptional regulator [Dyella solisilvae]|uniref:CopG family transcriptional regulator n=2 Tax=Dyella solisilvae TaxID=1920168 RepID=A0A370K5A9_9GAMM|nr:CopG family transcriptional regulator [Dyella solisilvae]